MNPFLVRKLFGGHSLKFAHYLNRSFNRIMKFKIPLAILFFALFTYSCDQIKSTENDKQAEAVEKGGDDKMGYTKQESGDDPNETFYLPKEVDQNEIYGKWKISSIVAGELTMHQDCDTEIEIEFSNTRNGQQSGIPMFDLKIGSGKEPCQTERADTRWSFNPYVENEIIIQRFVYSKERLSGSFKIIALDAKELILLSNTKVQLNFKKQS